MVTRATILACALQNDGYGVKVVEVNPGGPARQDIRINPGDLILAIDGWPTVDEFALGQVLARPNGMVEVQWFDHEAGKVRSGTIRLVPNRSISGDATKKGVVRTVTPPVFQSIQTFWVDQKFPLKPDFVKGLKDGFGVVPVSVDFRADPESVRQRINSRSNVSLATRLRSCSQPGS